MVRKFSCGNLDEFCKLYPNSSNKLLAEKYEVSVPTIARIAAQQGLTKSAEHMSEQQRQKATARVLSDKSRTKIGDKAKGRKMSEEAKRKAIATKHKNGTILKGEKHPFWKGGKPWERFKDPQYIQWRTEVLTRDNYICQDCGKQCNKREKGLAAHHIKPYSKYPELRFEVSNGITLCRKCHMARHGKTVSEKRVPCACGCETIIDAFDKYGRPRQYVNGHSSRGKAR
jgi:hypothetical protein